MLYSGKYSTIVALNFNTWSQNTFMQFHMKVKVKITTGWRFGRRGTCGPCAQVRAMAARVAWQHAARPNN
jgi:hypothetical protein